MAKRPAWSIQKDGVICESFDFVWNGGFSVTQKQKNIKALHQSIYGAKRDERHRNSGRLLAFVRGDEK